ncbi:dethiobiotin synthase [Campylobacter upsaliensis]|nr:dethiobiotin synthase [Campylobacter upsaliensis]
MQIYISGIHTDAGKTHFSAAFCANLNYDYFKLIQAGTPKDSDLIASLSPKTRILKEGFFLKTAVSPHLAKIKEKANYQTFSLQIPNNENLLIELAGGLFTPLDEKHTMIDFMQRFQKPTILVGRYYLGSINHILLSIEALKMRQIPILFLAMMGEKEPLQDEFIQNHTQIPIINLNFYNAKNIENEEFKRQIEALLRV